MIAKKYRFHGHNSLRFVYSKGKIVRDRYISLKYIKNERHKSVRIAVVVSKKVTKKAPVRNRIRRRIYEITRQEIDHMQPGFDLVITVFDERVATEPHEKLAKTIHDLLGSAHLFGDTEES